VIYLDHAATSPLRPSAAAALRAAYDGPLGNPSGAHTAARRAKALLEEARERVAARCGVGPAAVTFTSGGTEADNLAVKGVVRAARSVARRDPTVVVSAVEHKAVLAPADRVAAEGVRVLRAPVTTEGVVDLDRLADLLDERVVLVSVMQVNNETGVIQPLDDVAVIVRERAPRAVLHTDAVQGAVWCDPAAACRLADLVSLSAHKLGGPVGVGALVAGGPVGLHPEIEGGGQERGLRAGTPAAPGALAFAAALDEALATRAGDLARLEALRDRLEAGLLGACPGAWVNGAGAARVAGITNVGLPGVEAEPLVAMLDAAGLAAATGAACRSGASESSHVLEAMGHDTAAARSCLRLSLGWTTNDAEIDTALERIPALAADLARGLAAPVP